MSADDDLGAAWAEAEAALPEGWHNGPTLFGYDVADEDRRVYVASVEGPQRLHARRRRLVFDGDSPVTALRALAVALREQRP